MVVRQLFLGLKGACLLGIVGLGACGGLDRVAGCYSAVVLWMGSYQLEIETVGSIVGGESLNYFYC